MMHLLCNLVPMTHPDFITAVSYYTIRKSGKDQTFRTVRHMHHVCVIHIRRNSVHGYHAQYNVNMM